MPTPARGVGQLAPGERGDEPPRWRRTRRETPLRRHAHIDLMNQRSSGRGGAWSPRRRHPRTQPRRAPAVRAPSSRAVGRGASSAVTPKPAAEGAACDIRTDRVAAVAEPHDDRLLDVVVATGDVLAEQILQSIAQRRRAAAPPHRRLAPRTGASLSVATAPLVRVDRLDDARPRSSGGLGELLDVSTTRVHGTLNPGPLRIRRRALSMSARWRAAGSLECQRIVGSARRRWTSNSLPRSVVGKRPASSYDAAIRSDRFEPRSTVVPNGAITLIHSAAACRQSCRPALRRPSRARPSGHSARQRKAGVVRVEHDDVGPGGGARGRPILGPIPVGPLALLTG